jgi:hypothetical protein
MKRSGGRDRGGSVRVGACGELGSWGGRIFRGRIGGNVNLVPVGGDLG